MVDLNTPIRNCKRPGCDMRGRTRGLCDACYRAAQSLIKDDVFTWEELEEHGKVDPPRSRPMSLAKLWLTDWIKKPVEKKKGKGGWPKGKKRGPYKKRKQKSEVEPRVMPKKRRKKGKPGRPKGSKNKLKLVGAMKVAEPAAPAAE